MQRQTCRFAWHAHMARMLVEPLLWLPAGAFGNGAFVVYWVVLRVYDGPAGGPDGRAGMLFFPTHALAFFTSRSALGGCGRASASATRWVDFSVHSVRALRQSSLLATPWHQRCCQPPPCSGEGMPRRLGRFISRGVYAKSERVLFLLRMCVLFCCTRHMWHPSG